MIQRGLWSFAFKFESQNKKMLHFMNLYAKILKLDEMEVT